VLFGALLLALALIVLSLGTSANKADAATNIVTKTFSNSGQLKIPGDAVLPDCTGSVSGPAAPYPSEKSVSAFPSGSHIRDVNLTLKNYTHTYPDDVDVLLQKGTHNRTVMSDVGDQFDVSNISLVLNDEASSTLPETQLAGGSYKPRNVEDNPDPGDGFPAPAPTQNTRSALSGFDTLNPNGTWKLFVQDDVFGDCGKFGGGWSLTIKAAVPT